MDYKTIPFEVLETTNPYGWKWIVFLDATRTRTGIGLTRADAVLDAEFAIDQPLENRQCLKQKRELPWMLSGASPVNVPTSID
jgi:hypothetical protein